MKKDFYEVLIIKRSASDEQISTAFKKLALRHHPLKNPSDMNINLQKFHELCEAYEVLSNPQLKTIYDQFGEDILREGIRDAKGNSSGGYVYQQNCYQIFDSYFLQYNPFFNIYDNSGKDLHGSLFGTAYSGANEPKIPMLGDVFVSVPCTLLEFYNGCIKTVSYYRQTLAMDGHTIRNSLETKSVVVKPGYSPINTLTFKGEGNQQYRQPNTDLIVTFADAVGATPLLQHYTRKGHDLVYTYQISLQQSLNSEPARIKTLDGRILVIPVDQIITPKTLVTIANEGMPIFVSRQEDQQNQRKGNLFLKFEIVFPKTLNESQRQRIERILQMRD